MGASVCEDKALVLLTNDTVDLKMWNKDLSEMTCCNTHV